MSASAETLAIVQQYADYVRTHRAEFWKPQQWQRDRFFGATGIKPHVLLSAGNQVGKTQALSYLIRCHTTGVYPDWWTGSRFGKPILCWVAGVDVKQIARVWTRALLGNYQPAERAFDLTGMFAPEDIIHVSTHLQNQESAASIVVRHHPTGQTSRIEAVSYSQTGSDRKQAQALAGTTKLDLLAVDEQPPDVALSQMIRRTMHGQHINAAGEVIPLGQVIMAMTPELGATAAYREFQSGKNPTQAFVNVTWDDCDEWVLNAAQKQAILAAVPPYQQRLVSQGIPSYVGGQVYPVDEDIIRCAPFRIPDYWRQAIAIDFGFRWFAIAKLAYDPDAEVTYVTDCRKIERETPAAHCLVLRSMGAPDLPVIYPPDGDATEKGSGDPLISIYRDMGITNTVKFQNKDGSKSVEYGISDLLIRMQNQQFRVFNTLPQWFEEFRNYHRAETTGKPVKEADHLMDATRYGDQMVALCGVTQSAVTTARNRGKVRKRHGSSSQRVPF